MAQTAEQRKRAIEIELELRQRAASGGTPAPVPKDEQPEPFFDVVGMLQKSYPQTTEMASQFMRDRKAGGMAGPAGMLKDQAALARLGLAVIGDIGSYGARVVGALTGTSEFGDPEGGILKSAREESKEHFKQELAKNLKRNIPTLAKMANATALHIEDVVANFVISLAEDPAFLKSGVAATTRALQKAVPGGKSILQQMGGLTEAVPAIERAATKEGMEELRKGAAAAGKGEADVMAGQVQKELGDLAAVRQKELEDEFVGLTETHPVRAFHGTTRQFEGGLKTNVQGATMIGLQDRLSFASNPKHSETFVGTLPFRKRKHTKEQIAWHEEQFAKGEGADRIYPVKLPKSDLVVDLDEVIQQKKYKDLIKKLTEENDINPIVSAKGQAWSEIVEANPNKNVIEIRGAPEVENPGDVIYQVKDASTIKPLYGSRTSARTSEFARGEQLFESTEAARRAATKRFGAEEERTLGSIAGESLPMKEATMLEPQRSRATDIQGDILNRINYKQGENVTGYMGGRVFTKDDTDLLIRLTDDLKEVKSVEELLAHRRGVDELISYDEALDSRDFLLKGLRNDMNNLIEQSFYNTIKEPAAAKTMADAWRANNKFYADFMGSMGGLGRGLVKAESYAKTLDKMGIDKIRTIFKTAEKYKELAPVAEQIKAGYIDDLLLRSTDVDGKIDFKKAKKVWADFTENRELTDLVLSKDQQSKVDFAIKKFENTPLPGKYLGATEKGTADKLLSIASDDKRYAAKELEFLDNIMGRSGKDAMSYRAKAMSQAEQLGMSKEGKLPVIGRQVLSREVGTLRSQMRSPFGVVHGTKALNMLRDVKTDDLAPMLGIGVAAAAARTAADATKVDEKKPVKEEPVELEPGKPIMADLRRADDTVPEEPVEPTTQVSEDEAQALFPGKKKKATFDEMRRQSAGIPLKIVGMFE